MRCADLVLPVFPRTVELASYLDFRLASILSCPRSTFYDSPRPLSPSTFPRQTAQWLAPTSAPASTRASPPRLSPRPSSPRTRRASRRESRRQRGIEGEGLQRRGEHRWESADGPDWTARRGGLETCAGALRRAGSCESVGRRARCVPCMCAALPRPRPLCALHFQRCSAESPCRAPRPRSQSQQDQH